jgi:hypothetical protein
LLDVKFKRGFLKAGAKVEIRTKTFSKIAELPNKDGRLTFKVFRADFADAEAAVAKLKKDLGRTRSSYSTYSHPGQRPV